MSHVAAEKPLAAQPRDWWRAERASYIDHVNKWVAPRLERRAKGLKHPVDDFLWEYYPISPGKLRTWHPGGAIEAYESDMALFPAKHYDFRAGSILLSPRWIEENADSVASTRELLAATALRPARGGCFGLHEWAMVLGTDDPRHAQYPMRVSQQQIESVINDVGLRCTHFDAFRFFTPQASPRNPLQLTRALQVEHEQPGCLHANMDLYKHAVRLAPLIGSDVVLRAFALARDIREVDMRAAPYDLSGIGVPPLPVETEAGRSEFARLQQGFAARAAHIRAEILEKSGAAVTIG